MVFAALEEAVTSVQSNLKVALSGSAEKLLTSLVFLKRDLTPPVVRLFRAGLTPAAGREAKGAFALKFVKAVKMLEALPALH